MIVPPQGPLANPGTSGSASNPGLLVQVEHATKEELTEAVAVVVECLGRRPAVPTASLVLASGAMAWGLGLVATE